MMCPHRSKQWQRAKTLYGFYRTNYFPQGSLHLMALAPVGSKPTSVVMGPNSSEIKPITGTKLRNKNMASTKETKYVVDKIVCLFDSRNKPESDLLRNSSHSSVEVSGTHSMDQERKIIGFKEGGKRLEKEKAVEKERKSK